MPSGLCARQKQSHLREVGSMGWVKVCQCGHCPSTWMPAMTTTPSGRKKWRYLCSAGGYPMERRKCKRRVQMRGGISLFLPYLSHALRKSFWKRHFKKVNLFSDSLKSSFPWRWRLSSLTFTVVSQPTGSPILGALCKALSKFIRMQPTTAAWYQDISSAQGTRLYGLSAPSQIQWPLPREISQCNLNWWLAMNGTHFTRVPQQCGKSH